MQVTRLAIPEVLRIEPKVFNDSRGFFLETYSHQIFQKNSLEYAFIQDNHSYSKFAGTVRGLHFQKAPFAQTKLVRCTRGSIFDVAVDLRPNSPTYGSFVFETLSADNKLQLLIPKGFAHGFMTLEPDTEVQYKVDALYSPNHDRNIFWNDPKLAIPWPQHPPHLSDKDAAAPDFADADL